MLNVHYETSYSQLEIAPVMYKEYKNKRFKHAVLHTLW